MCKMCSYYLGFCFVLILRANGLTAIKQQNKENERL